MEEDIVKAVIAFEDGRLHAYTAALILSQHLQGYEAAESMVKGLQNLFFGEVEIGDDDDIAKAMKFVAEHAVKINPEKLEQTQRPIPNNPIVFRKDPKGRSW